MKEKLKNLGYYVLGIAGLLLLLLVSVGTIKGAVWVGEHSLQWFINFSWIVFAINLFIFLPLGLFRKTGIIGGIGMYISSFIFGLTLWFFGLLLTYFTWGLLGMFIGLILGGVGVVPIAMLAMLVNKEFFTLTALIVLTILTLGTRMLGIYLSNRAEEKRSAISEVKYE